MTLTDRLAGEQECFIFVAAAGVHDLIKCPGETIILLIEKNLNQIS